MAEATRTHQVAGRSEELEDGSGGGSTGASSTHRIARRGVVAVVAAVLAACGSGVEQLAGLRECTLLRHPLRVAHPFAPFHQSKSSALKPT